ncbi:MAG: sel1 repeat family protein, partial [Proteobacteria bacterium]|nr:sel1 repeat family protein [Pseudomonadota bacterium]
MWPRIKNTFLVFAILGTNTTLLWSTSDTEIKNQTVWQGTCSQGKMEYAMIMQLIEKKENEIEGILDWPLIKCKTRIKGSLKDDKISFTEYEIIEGQGVVLQTIYNGKLGQDEIKGEWRFKQSSGQFNLKKAPNGKPLNNINLLTSDNIVVSKDSSVIIIGETNKTEPFSEDLKKRAEAGDERAQYALGLSYFNGVGVEKNENEAKRWLAKAGQKTKSSMFNVINYKEEEYSDELVSRANQGDPASQCSLGMCLFRSAFGIKSIQEEAIDLLEKSAAQNNSNAQYFLGQFYLYGIGVGKNTQKGFELSLKSAEQGNAAGQLALGAAFLAGMGVEKDEKEGLK